MTFAHQNAPGTRTPPGVGRGDAPLIAFCTALPHPPRPPAPAANFFGPLAEKITQSSGRTPVFVAAVGLVLAWAAAGPLFRYSETWQLVVNTGTTSITFLMVFLVQWAQNKDSLVLHLKLNELLAAAPGASNRLINAQHLSEEEIKGVHRFFCLLAARAKADADLGQTRSVDEANENTARKRQVHA